MSIYDRAGWPTPECNPLVQLLLRPDDWCTNRELVRAFGLSDRRSLGAGGSSSILQRLGDGDTRIVERGYSIIAPTALGSGKGGVERIFSRKALILIAMNIQTPNAAAFRDWLASRVAGEVGHG